MPAPHVHFPSAASSAAPSATTRATSEADTSAGQAQLSVTGIKKSYRKGPHEVRVLDGVDLEVYPGEFLAIVGQSGSGKSTLLHLLGTLDRPDAGEVYLGDERIDNISARQRDRLRNDYFGMIFQFYHLLPELTALENVLAPMMIRLSTLGYWTNARRLKRKARALLESVGLGHRIKHKPRELSGGEMQRAAIARALIAKPQVLLADEPTGNLDQETGAEIMHILRTLNREQGLTIIMVTHDAKIACQADRVVQLVSGRVEQVGSG
ncbi:MAG: ABC transporter ATP-binding protein [Planctomycetota bacterium]|nr:MAG: ABC transporter ATP-binding protein [Planctomycetota bacterium]REJ97616.1 MAG: ABC transporter ATP-binding protein [Planctomycetota bacterium]REK23038.1 MAG: ABC transporter ATP-binding protein [Planctomycetota bacterium]REK43402.1 MAG: ABC transporter ATP-binding protein [Planctomycetota bacterium]